MPPRYRDFMYALLQLSSAALLLFLFYKYIRSLKKWMQPGVNKSGYLLILAGSAAFSVCFSILLLAVTHNRLRSLIYRSFWTYCEEARYFILSSFVLFLFLCSMLLTKPQVSINKKILRVIFIACCWIGITHGIYYVTKSKIVEIVQRHPFLDHQDFEHTAFLEDLARSRKQDKRDFVLVSEHYGLISYGLGHEYHVIRDVFHFAEQPQQVTRPTLFMFVVESEAVKYYLPRLLAKGFKLAHEQDGYHYFLKSQ